MITHAARGAHQSKMSGSDKKKKPVISFVLYLEDELDYLRENSDALLTADRDERVYRRRTRHNTMKARAERDLE